MLRGTEGYSTACLVPILLVLLVVLDDLLPSHRQVRQIVLIVLVLLLDLLLLHLSFPRSSLLLLLLILIVVVVSDRWSFSQERVASTDGGLRLGVLLRVDLLACIDPFRVDVDRLRQMVDVRLWQSQSASTRGPHGNREAGESVNSSTQ